MKLPLIILFLITFSFAHGSTVTKIDAYRQFSFSVYDQSNIALLGYSVPISYVSHVSSKDILINDSHSNNSYSEDPSKRFHLGGFLLGLLLGPIGVGITYFLKGDEDIVKSRRRWAWRGFLTLVLLLGAVLKSSIGSN